MNLHNAIEDMIVSEDIDRAMDAMVKQVRQAIADAKAQGNHTLAADLNRARHRLHDAQKEILQFTNGLIRAKNNNQ